MNYHIFAHDPKFFFIYNNPKVFPGLKLKLQNGSGTILHISLKKHVDLSRKNNPCNVNPDYDFTKCVIGSLARKVSCKLPWIVLSTGNLSDCTEVVQLRRWSVLSNLIAYGELEESVESTGCEKPCMYDEYILDEEEPYLNTGITWINIQFSNKKFLLVTEVKSYSLLSFLSDIGGSLGMFVGFSFLLVWDVAEVALLSCRNITIARLLS